MQENTLWRKEDVIKVVQATRGVDGRSKGKIIRALTAMCHDASPATESIATLEGQEYE